MKRLGFTLFIISLLLTSCVKEEPSHKDDGNPEVTSPSTPVTPENPEDLVEVTIVVDAPMTKTALSDTDSDGVRDDVVWQEGDMISVWDGYANRKFTMSGASGSSRTEFRGHVHNQTTKVFALYPYNENFKAEAPPTEPAESGAVGYARLMFPSDAIQTAVPGSFDPAHTYAVAESDDINSLTFRQRILLLKFSLAADMDDVVAVKFTGNAPNDYIWGTISIRFLDAGEVYPGVINKQEINPSGRGREITLQNSDKSPLLTGVDYYMSIPSTEFQYGYKMTFVHDDGSESIRSSATPITYNSSRIYKLASAPVSRSMLHSYKDIYKSTGAISVCGFDCAKSAYGEPIVIKSDQEYTITAAGAYFIEPGARVTLNPGSKDLNHILIVGDNKFERSTITQLSSVRLKEGGDFLIRNIDLTFTDGNFNLVQPTADVNRIEMQGCILRYQSYKYFLHATVASINRLAFYDNDVIFSTDNTSDGKSKDIFFMSTDSGESPVYKAILFRNNLFYHVGIFNRADNGFVLALGNQKKINKLSMEWNTFINLKTRSDNPYYIGGSFSTVDGVEGSKYVHNNLFYLPDLGAGAHRLLANKYSSGCTKYGVTYYTGTENAFKFSDQNTTTEGQNKEYRLETNPFTTFDPANGIFEKGPALFPSDGVNNYEIGAKRPLVIE